MALGLLCAERPAINEAFFGFLAGQARNAGALYILGDLFEYWAGDDDLEDPVHTAVASGLRRLSASGVPVSSVKRSTAGAVEQSIVLPFPPASIAPEIDTLSTAVASGQLALPGTVYV